jgi:hypothetical protein
MQCGGRKVDSESSAVARSEYSIDATGRYGMIIGVLSDTHGNVDRTRAAAHTFREQNVRTVIHCGDVGAVEVLDALSDFAVHLVLGNADRDVSALRRAVEALPNPSSYGEVYADTLDGVRVAAAHGHSRELERLTTEGSHQYVFHGHTHRRKDEELDSGRRVINPGALGGIPRESRSVCTVNLATGKITFHEL